MKRYRISKSRCWALRWFLAEERELRPEIAYLSGTSGECSHWCNKASAREFNSRDAAKRFLNESGTLGVWRIVRRGKVSK